MKQKKSKYENLHIRPKKTKKHRLFWFFVKVQIFFMMLVLAGVAYYFFGGFGKEVQALHDEAIKLVEESDESVFRQNQTSVVYDVNGELISTVKGVKDVYYLHYEDIPADFIDAIISIEDKKFYRHIGIDFKAIVRAAWAMVRDREVTQGGSTITQQLARTVFLSMERTWERKIEEIYIALELEQEYEKDDILEFYLNNVYFANGYYGIEAASQGYFSCPADELELSEVAFICAIPNNPSLYDPIRHKENTLKRRDRILKNMWEDGVISDEEYEEALSFDIQLNRKEKVKNNYVETYTYYCAIRMLMEQEGFVFRSSFDSEEDKALYEELYDKMYYECQKGLFTKGYRIYTSIDLQQQQILQQSIDEELAFDTELSEEGIYALQASGVCIDNETGYVTAIVGGRYQEYDGYTFNRAYQGYRQPGSSIKPLIVYAPAFEAGYKPTDTIYDEPIEDGPDTYYYYRDMTLREAVEKSANGPTWRLFETLTPSVGLQYLKEMNFAKVVDADYTMSSCLGGVTHGFSALEMTSAYATLENDGYFREPTCIIKITDAEGNTIVQSEMEEKSVYDTSAARAMTDVLRGVLTNGTGGEYGLTRMPCAGKTGTTNDNKDGWFVGYTPYYTTGIWVGYDMPRSLPSLRGATYPLNIWYNYMEKIHEELEVVDFLPYVDYNTLEDHE